MIFSRQEAIEFIKENPDFPIIIIGETTNIYYENLSKLAKNSLILLFDDIEHKSILYKKATEEQVKSAIEFAKDKEVIVACQAGISRSSAIAYLIQCSKTSPEEAILILDKTRHRPNGWVVELGSKILQNPKIMELYEEYLSTRKVNNMDEF